MPGFDPNGSCPDEVDVNPTIRSLLTNRNFILLWCAYGISAMGDHLSEMAILAHQNALDESVNITPIQARMTFVLMVPFFLLTALTGVIADRYSRRMIMITADLCRAAIMLIFLALIQFGTTWLGETWGPVSPLAAIGVFAALFGPARQAMVPTLVRHEELVTANAMIGGLGMIATMFATLVSGELAARGMIREAFHLNAVTFGASAVCVLSISRRWGPIDESRHQHRERFLAAISAGLRYVRGHRRVAQVIGIAVVFWFSGATVKSVVPAVVKSAYQGGFPEMARFLVWIGLGLAVGAILVSLLGSALRSDYAMTWSLMGTGLGVLAFAGSMLLGFAPDVAHVVGALSVFVMSVFGAGVMASYNAMLQGFVPNQFRGRVCGLNSMAAVGGLLLATGLLAIPDWPGIDRWVPAILVFVGCLLFVVGWRVFVVRCRCMPFDQWFGFCRNINEVMVKFWYRCVRIGHCTVPRTGPVIVTANHISYTDPLLILGMCNYRLISFMIAAEYYNLPIAGFFIRVAQCIPVRRGVNDVRAIKDTMRRLRDGQAVGIFIEGGIRGRQGDGELKNGVAMLALRTGATVIPVHLAGKVEATSVLKSLFSRNYSQVRFGQSVDLSEFKNSAGAPDLNAASRKIFEAIEALAPG